MVTLLALFLLGYVVLAVLTDPPRPEADHKVVLKVGQIGEDPKPQGGGE